MQSFSVYKAIEADREQNRLGKVGGSNDEVPDR
jgi:hypothetical protein